ncbi:MAG TPA: hypothetical protein VN837_00025 [Chloroflexota bacterium]|nr:hypothetical protein [Chloroflexota bacterium]
MELVDRIAEAVLYEGYLLYPYRRSAMKNQQRWQFGGIYPKRYSTLTGGTEPWTMQTQCLLRGNDPTTVEVRLRFLQVVDRRVAEMSYGVLRPVQALPVGGQVYGEWEEATERTVAVGGPNGAAMPLGDLVANGQSQPIEIAAGSAEEPLLDPTGAVRGALIREWQGVRGTVEVSAEPLSDPEDDSAGGARLYRLTVLIRNTTPWTSAADGAEPYLGARASCSHWRASARDDVAASQGTHVSRPGRLAEPPTGRARCSRSQGGLPTGRARCSRFQGVARTGSGRVPALPGRIIAQGVP